MVYMPNYKSLLILISKGTSTFGLEKSCRQDRAFTIDPSQLVNWGQGLHSWNGARLRYLGCTYAANLNSLLDEGALDASGHAYQNAVHVSLRGAFIIIDSTS